MTAPVSDGRHVYVRFGSNDVWCFSLDGEQRWAVWDHQPRSATRGYFDFIAAVLHKQALIIVSGALKGPERLRAYNPATGKKMWEIDWNLVRWRCGTPIIVSLEHMDVLVHTDGKVVRVLDGKVLADDLPTCNAGASPIANPDKPGLVYLQNGAEGGRGAAKEIAAVQLTSRSPDRLEWKEVWRDGPATHHCAAPVYSRGKLYKADGSGVSVWDALTGEKLPGLRAGKLSGRYIGVTMAGTKLLVSGDERIAVVETAPTLKVVARNRLWRDFHLRGLTFPDDPVHPRDYGGYHKALSWWGYTVPYASGNRLFLRSRDAVYCIGNPRQPYAGQSVAGASNGHTPAKRTDRPSHATATARDETDKARLLTEDEPSEVNVPEEVVTQWDAVLLKLVNHAIHSRQHVELLHETAGQALRVQQTSGKELVLTGHGLTISTAISDLSSNEKASLANSIAERLETPTTAAVAAFYASICGREHIASQWLDKAGSKADAVRRALIASR
jgi:hypothetical protein